MVSSRVYSFGCAAFAAFGAALFGYDLAVIASIFVAPDFLSVTGVADDPNYQGFIVSSMLLGAFVGSMPIGLIADRFGRRVAITFAAIVFILGGSLQTGANSAGMMLAGRFFAGFSIGGFGTTAPLYQSEIAHPSQRGRLMSTFQAFIGVGAIIAGWIAYGCAQAQYGTPMQWRLPLGFQMFPAVPLLCLSWLLPESPRWLMLKGRDQEALTVLAKLHSNGDVQDSFVVAEYNEMRHQITEEKSVDLTWKALWHDKLSLRKIFLGIVIQFSVQMTGVSAIQYYSPRIFESIGFQAKTTLLIQSINNIIGLGGEIVCIFFLDKTGRRFPWIFSNIISGCCFAVATAIAYQFVVGNGTNTMGYVFVVVTVIYNFIFSYGIGPLSWVYPVEIMNTGIRAKGSAITAMSSWLANFMIGQVSPIAFQNIGWRYYLVFTICSFTNALVFYLFFPETKDRTLEEMDDYFKRSHIIVPLNKKTLYDSEGLNGDGITTPQENLKADLDHIEEGKTLSKLEG